MKSLRTNRAPAWWGFLTLLWLAGAMSAFSQARFWPDASTGGSTPPALITNLAQLRALDESTAAQKIPVRLQAVVTYCEDQWPTLFVQDGDSAAYVYRPKGTEPLSSGDRVEIEGHCDKGFSPLIDASAIRKVGVAELPPPVLVTLEELGTGRYDGMWIRLVTTVRWMHITYRHAFLNAFS